MGGDLVVGIPPSLAFAQTSAESLSWCVFLCVFVIQFQSVFPAEESRLMVRSSVLKTFLKSI